MKHGMDISGSTQAGSSTQTGTTNTSDSSLIGPSQLPKKIGSKTAFTGSTQEMSSDGCKPKVFRGAKRLDKTFQSVNAKQSGRTQNPLLPSHASLHLAQLQAQLTLQRLKLAQTAVTSNPAAATVLNQVLSKVAMSQQLFNPLRAASVITAPPNQPGGPPFGPGMPNAGFQASGLPFPAQNPTLGPLVVGGLGCNQNMQNHNPNATILNPFGAVISQASNQQTAVMSLGKPGPPQVPGGFVEFNNNLTLPTSQMCSADAGQVNTHVFPAGMPTVSCSSALPVKISEGHYVSPNHMKTVNQPGFQKDIFVPNSQGQPILGMQPLAFAGEQPINTFQHINQKDVSQNPIPGMAANHQWENPMSFSQNKSDAMPLSNNVWSTGDELYNPEEPTSDSKVNMTYPSPLSRQYHGNQPFSCSQQSKSEEQITGGTSNFPLRVLQPHEINDFNGTTPAQLPHVCSICDKRIFNLKDWDQHVKGKLHIQKCMAFVEGFGATPGKFPKPNDINVSSTATAGAIFNTTGTAIPYMPASLVKPFPQMSTGFCMSTATSKYPQRRSLPGRVVHICNLPEGSCTENDVINLGLPFGKVTNYILMKSTNQAFIEMAYTEAAQAMVQFYKEKSASISGQKLLIRMSKRYKELKLKKPGKNIDSIIHDITSQRGRESLHDMDRYPGERTRSRSPIGHSLSARSHSPSFSSCSSSHSPLGTKRLDWTDEFSDRKASWEWSPHHRREEREDVLWKSRGEEDRDRTEKWEQERKLYARHLDKLSPKSLDERREGSRRSRDRYSKASTPSTIYSSPGYKSREEEHYRKESKSKSHKSHKRVIDMKSKRKENDKARERNSLHNENVSDGVLENDTGKVMESAKEKDPKKRKNCKKADTSGDEEKKDSPSEVQLTEHTVKDGLSSPERDDEKSGETKLEHDRKDKEEIVSNESESDEETWYPCSIEELVTVDEVGDEEDNVIEPDIAELEEAECTQTDEKGSNNSELLPGIGSTVHSENICNVQSNDDCSSMQNNLTETDLELGHKILLSAVCTEDKTDKEESGQNTEVMQHELPKCEHADSPQSTCTPVTTETTNIQAFIRDSKLGENDLVRNYFLNGKEIYGQENGGSNQMGIHINNTNEESSDKCKEHHDAATKDNITLSGQASPGCTEIELAKPQTLSSWEQEDVFSELSIPLGVEFVVPRTGFYCKLCGLFYTSEETAKTTHCRSAVHYRNLQRYLAQLAEESLAQTEGRNIADEEDAGIVPQFEKKKP
ncbi:RNA-binding protein 20 isoform X2 [Protopterus annectens]|uniref:RNA-binding protein 20 isoform X2 n=1 Tax=Protopterus annectens TaxID=7888 RepID=UPI001CFC1E7B|nr:RNA-binding protein 20 isoform X2 [Protopterus annectens]